MNTTHLLHSTLLATASLALACPLVASAQVATAVTSEPRTLASALQSALGANGLAITDVRLRNGDPLQIGTYSQFSSPPVTIADGIVLSTGSVVNLAPFGAANDPKYHSSAPPEWLTTAMGSGKTGEFSEYAETTGAIENYFDVEDVASVEIEFTLDHDSSVRFDFVFGSIEYPFWTGAYTDAFIVFLDDTLPTSQIAFDDAGHAIQVGQSFAELVTTADTNTAFSQPHGLIQSLTTTTAVLAAGTHTLWFEVGDINDQVIDSAVFIANLRAEGGTPGTGPTNPPDDCKEDLDRDGAVGGADLAVLLASWGSDTPFDLTHDDVIDGSDLAILLAAWGACPQ